jgi:hypothetical protein
MQHPNSLLFILGDRLRDMSQYHASDTLCIFSAGGHIIFAVFHCCHHTLTYSIVRIQLATHSLAAGPILTSCVTPCTIRNPIPTTPLTIRKQGQHRTPSFSTPFIISCTSQSTKIAASRACHCSPVRVENPKKSP